MREFEVIKEKIADESLPALAQIRSLQEGETIIFPIVRRSSIRAMISTYSIEWDKAFTTASNIPERTFSVTRIR